MRNCSSCNDPSSKLIDVYIRNWWDVHQLDFSRISRDMHVCRKCLIGWTVPAFRQGLGEWEFGLVEAFENEKHRILFDDEQREWIIVEASPFTAYIEKFKKEKAWTPPQYQQKDFQTPERNDTTLDTNTMKLIHTEDSLGLYGFETTTYSLHQTPSTNATLEKQSTPQPKSPPSRPVFRSSERNYRTPESARACATTASRYGYRHRSPRTPQATGSSAKRSSLGRNDFEPKNNVFDSSPDSSILRKREDRRKASQRLWTIEEDQILRQAIESSDCQWKWPVIAKGIPGRSGKQCRERYLNHLKPSLKLDSWSPVEDAHLYHLFHSVGTKWAMIAKFLPGRTDNSVKNRFHHLSRRFEKRFGSENSSDTTKQLERKLLNSRLFQRIKVDNLEIRCLVAHAIHKSSSPSQDITDNDKEVGPFRLSKAGGETCKRCCLQIPSFQTGRLVCESTSWCYTCAHISAHLGCGDLPRAIHSVGKLSKQSTMLDAPVCP